MQFFLLFIPPPQEVPIVSDSVCQRAMTQFDLTLDSTLICAGGEGKGACQVLVL